MTQARKAPDITRFHDRNAAAYLARTVAVDMSGPRKKTVASSLHSQGKLSISSICYMQESGPSKVDLDATKS